MHWLEKCERVAVICNGFGRGDGHDVEVYRIPSGRYLVCVQNVQSGRVIWRICPTRSDAIEHVLRDQRSHVPGSWKAVSDPSRLKDFRS